MNTPLPTSDRAKQTSAYLRTKVMTASPEELRLMLLDGAIKFARQGREGVAGKNFEQSYTGLSSARDIVVELMTSIRTDLNPDLAANVKAIYAFIYRQLLEGGHEKDLTKLDSAVQLLEYERETWVMLMQKLAEERTAAGNIPANTTPTNQPEPALTARAPLSVQG